MSVPSSSSKKISDNNKLGGTSPSPIEGIEGIAGPSSLDPMNSVFPQDEESEEYGDEADEDEEDSSEGESDVSLCLHIIILSYMLCFFVSFFFFLCIKEEEIINLFSFILNSYLSYVYFVFSLHFFFHLSCILQEFTVIKAFF